MPDTLPLHCPNCARAMRRGPLMSAATVVVRRACRCGERWQITLRPLPARTGGVRMTAAAFIAITDNR